MRIGKIKQIKLQPKYRELSCGQKIVPWLNVSGVWLEELGFKVGDTLSITTRESCSSSSQWKEKQKQRANAEPPCRK